MTKEDTLKIVDSCMHEFASSCRSEARVKASILYDSLSVKDNSEGERRYFRVTFMATHADGTMNGANAYATNGTYLGSKEIAKYIEEVRSVTNVVVTNIIELTEEDYSYYINN